MTSDQALDVARNEYRQVSVGGVFDVHGQVLISGRSRNDSAGYNVMTPLKMSDSSSSHQGNIVYVNRGWIPQTLGDALLDGSARADAIAPPGGYEKERQVVGLVRKNESKQFLGENKQITKSNPISPRISSELFEKVSGVSDADLIYKLWIQEKYEVVDGKKVSNKVDSIVNYPTQLEKPKLTELNHFSYALQWIFFGITALITWGVICKKALDKEKKKGAASV